eukprot:4452431-Pleurochrysis_carterae.AAC.1
MPEGLADPRQAGVAAGRRGRRERPALPRDTDRRPPQDADAPRPSGPISIADLFLPGVYAGKVLAWFAAADVAVAALRARALGEEVHVPRVPTVTITQEEMPAWARGT